MGYIVPGPDARGEYAEPAGSWRFGGNDTDRGDRGRGEDGGTKDGTTNGLGE